METEYLEEKEQYLKGESLNMAELDSHEKSFDEGESIVEGLKTTEQMEDEIVQSWKRTGVKFEDPDFQTDSQALYDNYDEESAPEYDKQAPPNGWMRPEEISNDAQLFVEGALAGDVKQGNLGDCWFLGALQIVATKPELLERLFVNTDYILDAGFITCQFFKNGEWKQVIVDTRVPVNKQMKSLVYSHCKEPNEF